MLKKENYFGMYLGQKVINIYTDNLIGNIITLSKGYVDLIPCKDTIEFYQYQSIVDDEEKYDKEYSHKGDKLSTYSKYVRKYKNNPIENCKLILRPLEDMTEEEVIKLKEITETTSGKIIYFERGTRQKYTIPKVDSSITEYLISIGIDVFNLKQKGFAVYESDLKGEN